MELEKLDGIALGKLVNAKQISPVEVIEYFAERIDSFNSKVNAFTYTKIDEALEEAATLENRIMQGEDVGPFAGVPVALKDFLPSKKGWTNSHGGVKHLICEDIADSEFYKAARKLGVIAIGKTNAPAFGFSGACQNALYGATRNPFDLTKTSGGSSGGTAAAVASGFITFGEGGDAGGSIRVPSSWCNLFGYKPSLGTVPSYCRPDGWSATHPYCFNGGLTKSVRDSATLLTEMAQYNPRDPISLPINSNKNFTELLDCVDIKNVKIAFTYDFDLYEYIDPQVKGMIYTTVSNLERAGASIDYVYFDFKHTIEEILTCWSWSISVDTAIDLDIWKYNGLDLVKDYREELPEDFIHFNEVAAEASIFDMRHFNEIRTDILDNFEDVFEKYDFILSPITTCMPFPISWDGKCKEINGHVLDDKLNFISFAETPLANFVGYPAVSVPTGLSGYNLPSGLQIIGKQYRDETVLSLAHIIEEINPWAQYYDKIAF